MARGKSVRTLIHDLTDAAAAQDWDRVLCVRDAINWRLNRLYHSIPTASSYAVGLEARPR